MVSEKQKLSECPFVTQDIIVVSENNTKYFLIALMLYGVRF
jgi:hypothetical protein